MQYSQTSALHTIPILYILFLSAQPRQNILRRYVAPSTIIDQLDQYCYTYLGWHVLADTAVGHLFPGRGCRPREGGLRFDPQPGPSGSMVVLYLFRCLAWYITSVSLPTGWIFVKKASLIDFNIFMSINWCIVITPFQRLRTNWLQWWVSKFAWWHHGGRKFALFHRYWISSQKRYTFKIQISKI